MPLSAAVRSRIPHTSRRTSKIRRRRSRISAIFSRSGRTRRLETYGCGKAVTDYHEVLSDPEVEAVSVCTPNNVHAPIAIDCLRAGKNVLCEKPAARTYAEALEMQKAQHETGKVLNIGVVNRFNDSVNQIKEYIDSGKLGDVFHVYVSFRSHRCIPGIGGAFTTKAIAGGGALIDWGVHFLDIVMYCCGDPQGRYRHRRDVLPAGEGHGGVHLYRNVGRSAEARRRVRRRRFGHRHDPHRRSGHHLQRRLGTEHRRGKRCYIDFMGDKAGIRLQYGGDFKVYTAENGALVNYTPDFEMTDMFANEINAFVDYVQHGTPMPSKVETVAVTAQLMQALYDSAAAHREVVL
ncbi:MAG: Gfo/Idh/MocA family oxidoreductase [Christensenellales bacterium]